MDFTQEKYRDLIRCIHENDIPVYGIREWILQQPANGILMRHDVDRKAINSLRSAEIEAEFGIKSTYNFRITKGSFIPEIIKSIESLGHEVGHHYEELALCGGDTDKAVRMFETNLNNLRKYARVDTATMHGSPLSKWDNRSIWPHINMEKLGLIGEAFLSIDYSDMHYITDTGRTWSDSSANLRDRTEGIQLPVASTDDLMDHLSSNPVGKLAIVTHPERWSINRADHIQQQLVDGATNFIKRTIRLLRK